MHDSRTRTMRLATWHRRAYEAVDWTVVQDLGLMERFQHANAMIGDAMRMHVGWKLSFLGPE